jgi:hypothetical protein
MVRISGTDTPTPDNAMILPLPTGCGRSAPSHGMVLQSEGSFMDGRKGDFLVFELSDPNDASRFTIFDVRNGHTLFEDGQNQITSIKLTGGTLHINYIRGINASCSLLSDRDGCWSQLLASGQIPRGAFSGPPSLATCKKGYGNNAVDQRSRNSDDYPSVISYKAALTLDNKGNATVKPMGPLHCDPAG